MFTEQEIVNNMLKAIGVTGLMSTTTDHPDYLEAKERLDQTVRSVNKLGLWYNTSYPTLSLNAGLEFVLPTSCLSVDPVDRRKNYVQRGTRLYDLDNETFNFTAGDTVKVKLVRDLSLSEMPMFAQEYVDAVSVYEFYLDKDGDENKLRRYEQRKLNTWNALFAEDLRNKDTNVFDNYEINRLARGRRAYVTRELRVSGNGFY